MSPVTYPDTPDSRKVDYILFNKFPFKFPERYILYLILILQKCCKASVLLTVVFQRGGFTVFADTVLLEIRSGTRQKFAVRVGIHPRNPAKRS